METVRPPISSNPIAFSLIAIALNSYAPIAIEADLYVVTTAKLSPDELREFDSYIKRFVSKKRRAKFDEIKKEITSKG